MTSDVRCKRKIPLLIGGVFLVAVVTVLLYKVDGREKTNSKNIDKSLLNFFDMKILSTQDTLNGLSSLTIKNEKGKKEEPTHVTDGSEVKSFKKTFLWQDIAYRRVNGSWVSDDSACTLEEVFDQTMLKTPVGNTPIFIHDVKRDHSVSRYLKETGNWEPDVMHTAFEVLKENKDHVFVDIGGNIGTFSLAAAKLGNRVISVEPYPLNTKRLCRGVIMGGFSGRMFIVNNAMSDHREPITFKLHPGDRAMTRTAKIPNGKDLAVTSSTTILLDDLLELFDFKSAVLKMDCEDCEWKVLTGTKSFFEFVDVRMVLIEWDKLIRNPHAPKVIDIMTKYGLVPYFMGKYDTPLDVTKYKQWTKRNIVFKKT